MNTLRNFLNADIILDQMSSDNWMEDYGENLKESIISNLSLSRNKILE